MIIKYVLIFRLLTIPYYLYYSYIFTENFTLNDHIIGIQINYKIPVLNQIPDEFIMNKLKKLFSGIIRNIF